MLRVCKLLLPVVFYLQFNSVLAQETESKIMVATGIELAWQFANYGDDIDPNDQIIRFSPINIQSIVAYDAGKIDYFSGLTLRNYGFSFPGTDPIDRIRYRTYNLGIPIGLRVGDELFGVYGGYELEFPLHYRSKTFSSDDALESNEREWFSDKVSKVAHGAFLGVTVFTGINIKMKYYFSNFFNKDYEDNTGQMPFANADVNVFQISFSFFLLRGTGFYHQKK